MATVFFGEKSFDDYVKNQIQIRQKATGRELGENILLGYFAKTCWVSLVSFVDINSVKLQNTLGVSSPQELSRKIVLRNGVTVLENSTTDGKIFTTKGTTIAGGIGPNKTYGNEFLSTNKNLKNPLGLRPIPGITSVDIKSKGTYGSLLEANINFICHDIVQLEKLEPLFMRPGYSVFLEWGWSQYVNNNGSVSGASGIPNILNTLTNKNSIQQFISKQRTDTFGNRDGMIGLIKNFTWSLKKDGGYDCKLTLISTGGVVEGIPIDVEKYNFTTKKDLEELDLYRVIYPRGVAELRRGSAQANDSGGEEFLGLTKIQANHGISPLYTCLLYLITAGEGNDLGSILSEESSDEFTKRFKEYLNLNLFPFSFRLKLPKSKDSGEGTEDKLVTYIPFKSFIDFINEYFTLRTGDNEVIVKFVLPERVKADWNQFSTDLTTCIIINQGFLDYKGISQLKKYKASTKNWRQEMIEENGFEATPYIQPISGDIAKGIYDDQYYGNLGNVFISVDCIYKAYSNNKTSLLNFMQSILDDINRSIGGINAFSTLIDPDNSEIARIIDTNYIESSKNLGENPIFGLTPGEFEIFNNKCILTNIQISSEIPNSMQTSIAIGASSGPSNDTSQNTNPYNAFSMGIADRLFKDKYLGEKIDFKEEVINYKRSLESLSQCFVWSDDYFSIAQGNSELESSLRNYINWVRKNTIYPTEASQAIIPLKLSFEIEGISGILIGQRFGIPTRILPSSYRASDGTPKVGFIVTEMSHKIDNNRWTTKVSALMYVLESKVLLDMQKDSKAAKPFLNNLNTLKTETLSWVKKYTTPTEEITDIDSGKLFEVYKLWYLASEDNEAIKEQIESRNEEIPVNKAISYANELGVTDSEALSGDPPPGSFGQYREDQKLVGILYLKNPDITPEEREIIIKKYGFSEQEISTVSNFDNQFLVEYINAKDDISKGKALAKYGLRKIF